MDKHEQVYSSPVISVIIPAYNAEAFIEKTLDSVLSQTYKNIEVIVVDDGSQDRTVEIVKQIAHLDRRIRLIQQANQGVAAARNLAIEKSRGQYIAPIDADDIWYPQKLEKQLQCMLEAEPSVGVVYAWSVNINEEDLLTGGFQASSEEGEVYLSFLMGNFVGNASLPLIRRSCLEQIGGYNCQLKEKNAQGCEDWDLYLRLAEYYQFRVVPEFLIGYREITVSMSHNVEAMVKSCLLVLADARKRNPEIPKIISQSSFSSYCVYIAHKYSFIGRQGMGLLWLYKAVKYNPEILLSYQFYELMLKFLVKLITQPVIPLIWQNYSWFKLKQKLKHKGRILEISDIYRYNEVRQKSQKTLYEKIKLRKLNEINTVFNRKYLIEKWRK
ncbi:glycosyl transferase family 2 [Cyanosarcina cf. burmensis CCALA 770]|nr:glycosyl transferase family 2 [Cyanosarcina cf. burmensis CCALA 770]